jgi:hypothetical protein
VLAPSNPPGFDVLPQPNAELPVLLVLVPIHPPPNDGVAVVCVLRLEPKLKVGGFDDWPNMIKWYCDQEN